MRSDADPEPVRLVDERGELGPGQLGGLGVLADDGACAGRHHLDEVRASPELLADSLAHVVRAVGLAVHRPEDATAGRRRRDDPRAREDARAGEDAELDGLAERDRLVVHAADVPHGGDPRLEERLRALCEDVVADLARTRELAVERASRAEARSADVVAQQMDMGVDETGKQRSPGDVDRPVGRSPGRVADVRDPSVSEGDDDAVARWRAGAVDETCAPEDELAPQGLHAHGVVPGVDVEHRAGHVLRVVGEEVGGGRATIARRRSRGGAARAARTCPPSS